MIKKFPIKKPYFYDTKEGIDYITKLSIEDNPKKLTPKELADIHKLGRDMKKSALEGHIKTLKPFDNQDPSTYPSRPEVRGKLLEIDKLEKDLAPKLTNLPIVKNNINNKPRSRTGNPSGRDYWKETVKLNVGNKGDRILPEVSPEDRNQLSPTKLWQEMYKDFTPFEKGTWNAEQRKNKLQRQKEEEEDKRKTRIFNHTKQQWGLNKKENEGVKYVGSREHLYDDEKKEVINKPKESLPGVQSILAIDLPSQRATPELPPENNQSLDQRLRDTKTAHGLSTELLGLQKQINRNIDYVLGGDQKDNLESRNNKFTTKEETYD